MEAAKVMPNGQCYVPFRKPGRYTCIVCRELKDAEEFYKDASRYNGCCSRCKQCDDSRDKGYKWSERQIKNRVEDIKSTSVNSTEYCVIKKDKYGLPVWIEKTTIFQDGSRAVTFEKGTGG